MLSSVARAIHHSGDHFGWSHTAGGVVHSHHAVLGNLTAGELFESRPHGIHPLAPAERDTHGHPSPRGAVELLRDELFRCLPHVGTNQDDRVVNSFRASQTIECTLQQSASRQLHESLGLVKPQPGATSGGGDKCVNGRHGRSYCFLFVVFVQRFVEINWPLGSILVLVDACGACGLGCFAVTLDGFLHLLQDRIGLLVIHALGQRQLSH